MAIRIYFEGDRGLRLGFRRFFKDVSEIGDRRTFVLVAGGSNAEARKDFERAKRFHPADDVFLLVDSEGPLAKATPTGRREFYMVQVMESWFLADREALAEYFGPSFNAKALPGSPNSVESILKKDVLEKLDDATRDCKKGRYSMAKVKHAGELLGKIDPAKVRVASGQCAELFTELRELASPT